jgi:hypothetical protein
MVTTLPQWLDAISDLHGTDKRIMGQFFGYLSRIRCLFSNCVKLLSTWRTSEPWKLTTEGPIDEAFPKRNRNASEPICHDRKVKSLSLSYRSRKQIPTVNKGSTSRIKSTTETAKLFTLLILASNLLGQFFFQKNIQGEFEMHHNMKTVVSSRSQ